MALSFHAIFPGQISDETAKINAIIVVDVNVSIRYAEISIHGVTCEDRVINTFLLLSLPI